MRDLELAMKRLQLVKESLETDTIDFKSALEIVITHVIEIYETMQERENFLDLRKRSSREVGEKR